MLAGEFQRLFDWLTTITDANGEPWFLAKEVCEILGYKNPWDAIKKHVRPHQKNSLAIRDGNRGNPNKTIINRDGLNRLILRSDLPDDRILEFQDRVTDDVIPQIMKTGG